MPGESATWTAKDETLIELELAEDLAYGRRPDSGRDDTSRPGASGHRFVRELGRRIVGLPSSRCWMSVSS